MRRVTCLLLFGTAALAQSWYNSAWTFREAVVFDHRYVIAPETDFVATIPIDSATAGHLRADCADLLFTSADGVTKLNHLIVGGTCGTARPLAKVRIPSLSAAADTVILMYSGNAAAADQSNAPGVWPATYANVYIGDSLNDLTANGRNLTAVAGAHQTDTGQIGTAFKFRDLTTELRAPIPATTQFSISFWVRGDHGQNHTQAASGATTVLGAATDANFAQWWNSPWDYIYWGFQTNQTGPYFTSTPIDSRPSFQKYWHLATAVCDGSAAKYYEDGALHRQAPVANCTYPAMTLSLGMQFGQFPFQGLVNDVEFQTVAQPKEFWYIKWLNEDHPEYFISYGSLQSNITAAPSIDSFTSTYYAVEPGQSVTLRWIVSGNPVSVSIDQGVGWQSGLLAGLAAVAPAATTTYTLTATNGAGSATKTVTVSIFSATPAYLRSGPPAAAPLASFANGAPATVYTIDPLPVVPGQYVGQYGFACNDAAHSYQCNLNGVFKVKQVLDSSTYTVTDLSGNDITPNGNYLDGSWNPFGNFQAFDQGGAKWAGAVVPYRPVPGPKGRLDGTTGRVNRLAALGTHNGLVSLIVNGDGTATVTTSFDPVATLNVAAGNSVSIWNTTNSSLNNGNAQAADYTVSSVSGNTFTLTGLAAPSSGGPAAGDFTNHPACGPSASSPAIIGGSLNCVRLSFFAVQSNPEYRSLRQRVNAYIAGAPTSYMHPFDGGTFAVGDLDSWGEPMGLMAIAFTVDQANQAYLNALLYHVNNLERASGINWVIDSWAHGGSNNGNGIDYTADYWLDITDAYEAVTTPNLYLTPAQKTAAAGKLANHHQSPMVSCNPVSPRVKIVSAKTFQAGSTATTAVLNTSETLDFTNNFVAYNDSGNAIGGLGNTTFARISAYNTTTKVATLTDFWGTSVGTFSVNYSNPSSWTPPPAGTPYQIYAGVALNGSTVTGYNTTFTTDLSSGDGISVTQGDPTTVAHPVYSGIALFLTNASYDMVSAIASDTSLTAINSGIGGENMGTTSRLFVYVKKPAPGDCGLTEVSREYEGDMGTNAIQNPPTGGALSAVFGNLAGWGSNNGPLVARAYMALGQALLDDSPTHAQELIQRGQNWFWDYSMRWMWEYVTPVWNLGSSYSWGNGMERDWFPLFQHKNVQNFPMPAISEQYWGNWARLKMYSREPEGQFPAATQSYGGCLSPYNCGFGTVFGANGGPVPLGNNEFTTAWWHDMGFVWQPQAIESGYLKDFLNYWGLKADYVEPRLVYYDIDPRLTPTDHKVEPLQFFFSNNETANCNLWTGWPCNLAAADTIFSKTSWTDPSSTEFVYHARSYYASYDCPSMGGLHIRKVGWLTTNDAIIPGRCDTYGGAHDDATEMDSAVQFNGATSIVDAELQGWDPVRSKITRYASGNSGLWNPHYGDQASRYMYALHDCTECYAPTYNHVWRHIVHFKKPGTEEIIMQYDDIDATNQPAAKGILTHVHYAQNGEILSNAEFEEGTTNCQGCAATTFTVTSGGSAAYVLSTESGLGPDADGPARIAGLITKFLSPATITVRDDGSSYPGARGHTHRVTVAAGSSVGAPASTLQALMVHKLTANFMTDNTLTATALNPSAGWTGVQTFDKVALFAVGGQLQTSVSLTTTHAGTAQYLLAGLAPGTYDVHVNGASVLNGATVFDADNSLYFESTAGVVSVVQRGTAACQITTTSLANGTMGTSYSQALQTTNCASPILFSLAGGALCAGLSLDPATGAISGVPAAAGTCAFNIEANTAVQPFTITIGSAGGAFSKGISISRGAIVH